MQGEAIHMPSGIANRRGALSAAVFGALIALQSRLHGVSATTRGKRRKKRNKRWARRNARLRRRVGRQAVAECLQEDLTGSDCAAEMHACCYELHDLDVDDYCLCLAAETCAYCVDWPDR